MSDTLDPIEQAYEICKEQASVDGAFSENLLRFWFQSAWDLCVQMTGFVYPPRDITEPVTIRENGSFRISHVPSSDIRVYDGSTLVMVVPKSGQRDPCHPGLCPCCACCGLRAMYTTGEDLCTISPTFLMAVARIFSYLAENRGDTAGSENLLTKSGAMQFLGADVTYIA